MKIEDKLVASVINGLKALYGQEVPEKMVQLQKTKKEFEGHLTLVAFPFLKMSRKGPEQTAQEIGEYLKANEPAVAAFNVIKGFLNLTIASATWIELLNEIQSDEEYGLVKATETSPLVMIEYSSPNTNKPLHLGHVRNNLLGNALANIVAANGNKVVKTNIVNDRGIHICKSMLAWKKYGNGETPESTGKKGDHLVGDYYVSFDKHYKAELAELMEKGMTKEEAEAASPLMQEAREMLVKWEAGDPEVRALWEMMNNWVYAGFDETYRKMGVGFDKIYYESNTYLEGKEKVMEGLEKGFFFKKEDGSVWADLTAEGLDHKLLLRGDGTSVYMTQDIGTAKLRFADYPIDKMIYVVGNEQNYHFQVLSILLDKLGFEWGKGLVHFSYGMVELPEGKMKSREGTVVDADDLMEEMVSTAKETSQELGKLDGLTQEEADVMLAKHTLWLNDAGGIQADFSNCFVQGLNLAHKNMMNVAMDNARFVNTDLQGAELNFSVANDTRFESCNLEDVTAEECEFKNTVFSKCKMSGGTYTHSDLSDAVMIECKMEYGSFQNCCTDGTNFCGLDDYAEINMRGCNSDREDWRRDGFDPELTM